MQLVLVFCLMTTGYCREERPLMADLPPNACVGLTAQVLAAQWVSEHPLWVFRRSRCEAAEESKPL